MDSTFQGYGMNIWPDYTQYSGNQYTHTYINTNATEPYEDYAKRAARETAEDVARRIAKEIIDRRFRELAEKVLSEKYEINMDALAEFLKPYAK